MQINFVQQKNTHIENKQSFEVNKKFYEHFSNKGIEIHLNWKEWDAFWNEIFLKYIWNITIFVLIISNKIQKEDIKNEIKRGNMECN